MPDTPTAPVILGDRPGSFPHGVLAERHPAIIRQVREAFPYEPGQRRALDALMINCTGGGIEPLPSDAHDREHWVAWGMDRYAGQSWYDVPWLWSESWFYRRLLEAVGYFGPGPWQGIDPFRPSKRAELDSPATDAELTALEDLAGRSADEQGQALLHGSLWGNRADLGFRLSAGGTDLAAAVPALVADDSEKLWSLLHASRAGTLVLVADNAGRELVPDLLLVAHLLAQGIVNRVVLHVKPYPYYVSDATTADVVDALYRLVNARGTAADHGRRLWRALSEGQLVLRAHPFSCSPLPYEEMPDGLRSDFAPAALTLVKGDLNYRRLVGDRTWPSTMPFADVTGYFPGPVAALRTLKSDVVTGLTHSTEKALVTAEDQRWRTSGTHALIQVRA